LDQALALRERFDQAFWCEPISSYALALDGEKRQCQVRASNAGHCLFAGIAKPERAVLVAQTLMSQNFFSGWGVRTVAASEARYSPMSYHNGSVWPHDNALIAAGLARYGRKDLVLELMAGLFDASRFFDLQRMPELFCGFERRLGEGPTLYPVACAPQSWSATAIYLLLEACLGLRIDGRQKLIQFDHPQLPVFLKEVELGGICVGNTSIDLLFQRHTHDVGINVLRKEGDMLVNVVI
jgi:glycogen debranching enzyme